MSSLLFIGDICANDYSLNDRSTFEKSNLYHFLSKYNGKIIGNLEAPILEETIKKNESKYSLLNPLSNEIFFNFCSVVTLANNHIFDQGIEGYHATVKSLENMSIQHLGAGENVEYARAPIILKIDNYNIALLSYNCYSTNSLMNADSSNYGTAPLLFDFIENDINKIKKDNAVDKIIVLPHWGIENQFFPTAEQVCFARRMIDIGVDAIIGSHTHTIQTSEKYKGKYIYYSLGNFLFNNFTISSKQKYYQSKFNREGLIVELKIENDQFVANEYFIKLNGEMLPEFCDIEKLSTPIANNNKKFRTITKKLNCKNVHPELSLSLKYNGKNAQIVYTSKSIENSIILNIETARAKLKRLVIYRLRKLLS